MAAPGILDGMMAKQAWDGQMTDEPASGRPDNLFEPVDEDRGARGRFTEISRRNAVSVSAAAVKGAGVAAAIILMAGLLASFERRRR
jgi:hypothetical protein